MSIVSGVCGRRNSRLSPEDAGLGKTELIRKAYEGDTYVYLFVERKNERDLCENFQSAIESALKVPIYGTMTTVQQVLEFLFTYAESNQLTLVIGEVKREKERVDLKALRLKFDTFVKASGKYRRIKPNFIGLSIEDM